MSLDLRIDPAAGYVEKTDGTRTILTASERRALELLVANPHRLLTRNQILDAVSEPGSDKNDRNIDFLINRLRRKLEDNARKPRFIATRYGEGYVWVGGTGPTTPEIAEADIVVGPILGRGYRLNEDNLDTSARRIFDALSTAADPGLRVIYAPDCPPAERFDAKAPSHNVEIAFLHEEDRTSCVVTLREFRSGRSEAARRFDLDRIDAAGALDAEIEALLNEGWLRRARQPSDKEPLPVSAYGATVGGRALHLNVSEATNRRLSEIYGQEKARSVKSLSKNERRLRALLDDKPDNPDLKLMLAMTIHSKYVIGGATLFADGKDRTTADEDEIETLVTEALPHIRSEPNQVIVAGKLLHFLKRGHDELARDLCESAYAESVSVAGSLSVIGQMRSFFGETEPALRCLDQALHFSKPGSHAWLYTMVIKCQALAAAGDWDGLRLAWTHLKSTHRLAGFAMEPLFSDPRAPSALGRATVYLLPRRRLGGMLMHVHYVGARLFSDPQRGTNLMSCLGSLAVGRHGPGILPQAVAAAYPGLAAASRAHRK